jgi:hypothetical protein
MNTTMTTTTVTTVTSSMNNLLCLEILSDQDIELITTTGNLKINYKIELQFTPVNGYQSCSLETPPLALFTMELLDDNSISRKLKDKLIDHYKNNTITQFEKNNLLSYRDFTIYGNKITKHYEYGQDYYYKLQLMHTYHTVHSKEELNTILVFHVTPYDDHIKEKKRLDKVIRRLELKKLIYNNRK